MIKSIKQLYKYNFITSILGIINLFILLKYIGISDRTDMFFGAYIIVTSFSKVLMTGFFNEIIVPIYTKLYSTNRKYSFYVISTFLTTFISFTTFLIVLLYLLSDGVLNLIYGTMSIENLKELKFIFILLLPQMVFLVFNEMISSILNAIEVYGKQEKAKIYSSLMYMLILLSLYPSFDIYALVIATWSSFIIQFIFLYKALKQTDIKIFFLFRKKIIGKFNIYSKINISFFYVIVTQIFTLYMRSYLVMFGEGFLTVVHYIGNIIIKLRTLIMKPILTILLTEFSKQEKTKQYKDDMGKIVKYIILFIGFLLIASLLIKNYGIYLFVYIIKFTEYKQILDFSNLIWFYVAMFSLDIVYGLIRKKIVAHNHFNIFYKGMIASQFFNIALVYIGVSNNIVDIKYLFLIVFLDVFIKLLYSLYLYRRKLV
jgi:peptidoglycan biosynthesis protein MviN/MurJ (putative lipid II flippase)